MEIGGEDGRALESRDSIVMYHVASQVMGSSLCKKYLFSTIGSTKQLLLRILPQHMITAIGIMFHRDAKPLVFKGYVWQALAAFV